MGPQRRARRPARDAPRCLVRPSQREVRDLAEKLEAMALALDAVAPDRTVFASVRDPIRILGHGKRPGACQPGAIDHDGRIEDHGVTQGKREAQIFSN